MFLLGVLQECDFVCFCVGFLVFCLGLGEFLSDSGADFWQGFLQVVGHGPDGEYDGYPEKPVAPDVGVDEVEEAVVVEQQGDGCHLDAGFEFAQDVYGYAA